MTFAQEMARPLIICGIFLALVACDSSVTDSSSYASPDGKKVVAVAEELQGANDPAPWWTHVSLRDAEDDFERIPGNLLKLEGRGSIEAKWISNTEVVVCIDDSIWDDDEIKTPILHDGVSIRLVRSSVARVLERSSSTWFTQITNNEQGRANQPTTAPESKSEGNSKSQLESEGRPQ